MIKTFIGEKDFDATCAAEEWLTENGYSFGSMQRGAPRGIVKGKHYIRKWRDMDAEERAALDGTITGDGRHGPITVTLKDGETTSPA